MVQIESFFSHQSTLFYLGTLIHCISDKHPLALLVYNEFSNFHLLDVKPGCNGNVKVSVIVAIAILSLYISQIVLSRIRKILGISCLRIDFFLHLRCRINQTEDCWLLMWPSNTVYSLDYPLALANCCVLCDCCPIL